MCEQIGDHCPLNHTVLPIQRVFGKMAALPHFFQLRLFVRPASLAPHANVDVHGIFASIREKPRNGQKLSSDLETVSVASVGQIFRGSKKRSRLKTSWAQRVRV